MEPAAWTLDSLLNNLDRLYDRHCTPADTRDLLVASAAALSDDKWSPTLLYAAEAIEGYRPPMGLVYAELLTDSGWYEHTLTVTAQLRQSLADDWSARQHR